MSPEQWSATIDEILAYAQELDGQDNPEPLEGEDAASEGDEGQLDNKGLFGENGEGKARLLQTKDGQKLIYKGFVQDSNGHPVEAQGVLDVKGFDDDESPFSSTTQASFSYNADTHHLTTTLKDDNNYVVLNQDLGDAAPLITQTTETIDGREVKVIDIKVQSFIAAPTVKLTGVIYAGDNCSEGEPNTFRTLHQIQLSFDVQTAEIINVREDKKVGQTKILSEDGKILRVGQASGESLQYTVQKKYNSKYNQEMIHIQMKGNGINPIASLLNLVDIPSFAVPGITYDFEVVIDDKICFREAYGENDKFPTYRFYINNVLIEQFFELPDAPSRLIPLYRNHVFHTDEIKVNFIE